MSFDLSGNNAAVGVLLRIQRVIVDPPFWNYGLVMDDWGKLDCQGVTTAAAAKAESCTCT